jgi:hypothetical protein
VVSAVAEAGRAAKAVIAPAPAKNLRLVIELIPMAPFKLTGETVPLMPPNVKPMKRLVVGD